MICAFIEKSLKQSAGAIVDIKSVPGSCREVLSGSTRKTATATLLDTPQSTPLERLMSIPFVKAFFDRPTGSLQYVFHDPASLSGAIVDPVWNFYPEGAAVTTESADEILDYVQGSGIKIEWILDTHPHADHFSAAPYLAGKLKAPCAIGEKVTEVQKLWKRLYHLPADFPIDGRQWDRLFADGDTFMVGSIPVRVMFSPGHTLASITYVAGDAAFVHDTLMYPESGTSRADFPGGSSRRSFGIRYAPCSHCLRRRGCLSVTTIRTKRSSPSSWQRSLNTAPGTSTSRTVYRNRRSSRFGTSATVHYRCRRACLPHFRSISAVAGCLSRSPMDIPISRSQSGSSILAERC